MIKIDKNRVKMDYFEWLLSKIGVDPAKNEHIQGFTSNGHISLTLTELQTVSIFVQPSLMSVAIDTQKSEKHYLISSALGLK